MLRAGRLSGAGDGRLAAGLPTTVVQEPGAGLEGAGQAEAAQVVDLVRCARGGRARRDRAGGPRRPGSAGPGRVAVGHGTGGGSGQLAVAGFRGANVPSGLELLYILASGWGPHLASSASVAQKQASLRTPCESAG